MNLKARKLDVRKLQLTRGAYLNGGLLKLTSTIKFEFEFDKNKQKYITCKLGREKNKAITVAHNIKCNEDKMRKKENQKKTNNGSKESGTEKGLLEILTCTLLHSFQNNIADFFNFFHCGLVQSGRCTGSLLSLGTATTWWQLTQLWGIALACRTHYT